MHVSREVLSLGVAAVLLGVPSVAGFSVNNAGSSSRVSSLAFAPSGHCVSSSTLTTTPSSLSTPALLSLSSLSAAAVDESEKCSKAFTAPNNSPNAWEVHKFGGASLATAALYETVGDLLIRESAGREDTPGPIPTMAVVSARGGMTDLLVKVVDGALLDMEVAEKELELALEGQLSLLRQLASPEITDPIEARFRKDAEDILSVVQSLRMIRSVPPTVMEVVSGFGEIWSAQTLYAYLKQKGVKTAWIDARDILIVKSEGAIAGLGEKGSSSTGGVTPLYPESARLLSDWWNSEYVTVTEGLHGCGQSTSSDGQPTTAPIIVATGFVATTSDGVPTTLKRSGSDYSATIFAKLADSSRVTMWKNTDGVYTADPRRVPEAFSIASLKYDEAMELAFFGAQVLHPSAMVPCIEGNIPVYVRNIFNQSFKGTVIQGRCASLEEASKDENVKNWRATQGNIPIKGITSVDRVSLLTLEGASVIGGAEVAERFMGAMADNDIDVLIITQASSESSITVVVPENQGKKGLAALESTFELEISRSNVNSISLSSKLMSIVAIVGEGMAMNSGVSATFMNSLAKANVNIRVIAQGSSERQVAVVVENKDTSRALRAAHQAFTLSQTTASIAILGGTGKLGSALLRQLHAQKESLAKNLEFGICVSAVASSTRMVGAAVGGSCIHLSGDGSDMSEWLASDEARDLNLEELTTNMNADVNPHRVIIDCTDTEDVADYYDKWMSAGISIISPGRKASAGCKERYASIREAQRANAVEWQYESSVGSALPIVTTLRDLLLTGDEVRIVKGCLSGTMAYVFSTMNEDITFSEAVRQAAELDYAENDMREDLSGEDVKLKMVVLAREMGLDVSPEDVEVESLLPEGIAEKVYGGSLEENTAAMIEDLKALDGPMLERWKQAKADDCELRYKFLIDVASGKCKCSLEAVGRSEPLFRLRNNENLVAFETARYKTSPLIVKGAAAGPELAAAGMFADLLRLGRAYSSYQT